MVYANKFVASIKCNGKILREVDGDNVYIPFGSEYSILLKNMNSRLAVVSISIDGEKFKDDLVVHPNRTVEIERFIDGDLNKGYKLKFIEKTNQISEFRGDKIDDGLISVEYRFEKEKIEVPVIHYRPAYRPDRRNPWNRPYGPVYFKSSLGDAMGSDERVRSMSRGIDNTPVAKGMSDLSDSLGYNPNIMSYMSTTFSSNNATPTMDCFFQSSEPRPASDEGITVKGGDSNQSFSRVEVGELESNSQVIVIKLHGKTETQTIVEPVLVAKKLVCPTCGLRNKSNKQFCSRCGTNVRPR